MECTISWLAESGMAFSAETGSGHLLTMDGAPDGGGRNLAPRPMETVLAGTGACSAYDVVLILKRGRHDVRGCRVKVTSERAPTDPKVFTAIHLHFVVSGVGLPEAAVARAIALSHEKYCSATIMLARTAAITTSHEVVAVPASIDPRSGLPGTAQT
jgi:putative redox protein